MSELQPGPCGWGILYHPSGKDTGEACGSGLFSVHVEGPGGGYLGDLYVPFTRGASLLACCCCCCSRALLLALGLDQPVLLHICLDQTKVKPKESIRSAAETPITCLRQLAPLQTCGRASNPPLFPSRRQTPAAGPWNYLLIARFHTHTPAHSPALFLFVCLFWFL